MELGPMKQRIFLSIGWLSVIMGLVSLVTLNIFLLWNYDIPIVGDIFFWISLTLISGVVSIFNKNSRSLGLWGLGIGVYLGAFVVVMFVLGWAVTPFP
ncbi:hypothetical protein [Bacillus tuaregi]|uniref:hypothetical protein n=1 Tax=Bacillus tuaregi TaxID=1816695 RepID=UPI0008F87638|nr:hypothetical protein [Bacillus tuaregi]